jgi:hypothetical protein
VEGGVHRALRPLRVGLGTGLALLARASSSSAPVRARLAPQSVVARKVAIHAWPAPAKLDIEDFARQAGLEVPANENVDIFGDDHHVLRSQGELFPVSGAVCQGRKPPFWVVKRPARPYKSAIEIRFDMGNAKGA